MGHRFDFFHISGNILWLIQSLKLIESGFTAANSHNFNILKDISSCPWALQILSDFINLIMSLSSNSTEERLLSVIKVSVAGILLLLSNGVQLEAKKIIKVVCFLFKA